LTFQFAERGELAALEFPDPPLADLMDRDRVEIMQLLAAVPERGDEVGRFENARCLVTACRVMASPSQRSFSVCPLLA